MRKKIQRPENWQDFESLCKMLWGEIWQCDEIQKNGRSGQGQRGVDVYGIPVNEVAYYGIQCKGKDDYLDVNFTTTEIDIELTKAQKFKPLLKKFYFATTAKKDVNIEEYIRIKNLEFKETGLFEVHLFAWDDITDLIYANKNTLNSYLNGANFNSRYSIDVSFQNNLKILECNPEYEEHQLSHHNYKLFKELGIELNLSEPDLSLVNPLERTYYLKKLLEFQQQGEKEDTPEEREDPQPLRYQGLSLFPRTNTQAIYNKSVSKFSIVLKNTGNEVLEDYKIYIKIDGVISADSVNKNKGYLDLRKYEYNAKFTSLHEATLQPVDSRLVQNDTISFDEICFKPYCKIYQIKVVWSLFARNFTDSGELVINIIPVVEVIHQTLFDENAIDREPRIFIKNKYEYR